LSDTKTITEAIKNSAQKVRSQLDNDDDYSAVLEAEALANNNYYEQQRMQVEVHGMRERNRDRRLNRILRKNYAKAVMRYLCAYSIAVRAPLKIAPNPALRYDQGIIP
jgi:hypothetical protein